MDEYAVVMRLRLQDGLSLFVDVDGSGLRPRGDDMEAVPTLILLHGGPGFDHSVFKPYFTGWTDDFQIIYYDHRGMGRSDTGTASSWTLSQWADDLDELIERLDIVRPIVLGQSFGGYVALEYAITRSHRLSGLILSSTGARAVTSDCLAEFERLGGSNARQVARDFFSDPTLESFTDYRRICFPLYNTTDQDPAIAARQIVKADLLVHFFRGEHRTFDFRPQLDRIDCPTLVIGGEDDPITPAVRSRELAEGLSPDLVDLRIVPRAGHGVYRDNPGRYRDLVRAFLSSVREEGDRPGRSPSVPSVISR
jgi:pimeloyl-ACP methyl ester carboxylesterase